MNKIYIALDGGKKLSLGSLQSFQLKDFKLRTVDINQFQAKIAVGLSNNEESYLLHSSYVQNLKPAENGFSYLFCQLKKEGNKLTLVISNDKRIVCRETFSILPPEIRKKRILIASAITVFFASLAILLLFTDFSFISISPPSSQNVSQSSGLKIEKSSSVEKISTNVKTETTEISTVQNVPAKSDPVKSAQTVTPVKEIKSEPSQLSLKERSFYFSPNSSQIDKDTEKALEKILSILLDYPDLRVTIAGHCAIAGTEAGRREISVQRAENVFNWLTKRGWVPLHPPEVTGEAGNYPITLDPDVQDINRRVEIDYSN